MALDPVRRDPTRRAITAVLFTDLVALGIVVMSGCPRPRPDLLPEGTKVSVVEFAIAGQAQVSRYDAPYDTMGMELAEAIANKLRDRRREAVAIPSAVPPEGDLIVSGRITRIDGGSVAARRVVIGLAVVVWPIALMASGAGHATFGAEGEIRRADGTQIATFSEQRTGGGWREVSGAKQALRLVGYYIGDMIYLGQYRGGRPGSPGYLGVKTPSEQNDAKAPSTRGTADRLRELDSLRAQGLLSDDEYREKRRRILEEF